MALALDEDQLADERRTGRYAAAAAVGSILMQFMATVVQLPALQDAPSREDDRRYRESLINIQEHGASILASSILSALAALLAIAALYYLFRATRHRREQMADVFKWLLFATPVLLLVAPIILQLHAQDLSDRFFESGGRTNDRARDLIEDNSNIFGSSLGLAGSLGLALSYVFISLNAMRAGLLSQFMGILGIVAGALIVLPLLPSQVPVVQVFWLGAFALLALDRWPGGRGPAWESGRAERWPSAAERRGLVPAAREPAAPAEPEPVPERPRSRKRKKRG